MTVATHYPVCAACGSSDVVRDAWAGWEPLTNQWTLDQVFDHAYCRACDGEASLIDEPYTPTERIQLLNDALRTGTYRGEHDRVMVTIGISSQGDAFVQKVMRTVAEFSAFGPDNDLHSEYDFGQVTVDGQSIFFKHDYYGLTLEAASPNPADPAVTARVLTVMTASEY